MKIAGKLPSKGLKKRKPQRRPPFMTGRMLHAINEVHRMEGLAPVRPGQEVTLEDPLAMEAVADPPQDERA